MPNMGRGRVLLVVGLALLAAGLLWGFLPRSAGGVGCGSAFVGSRAAEMADLTGAIDADTTGMPMDRSVGYYADRCADVRSAGRIPAILLIAAGTVLSLGGYVAVQQPQP